jgi:probable HAF family extracellular repeat protein
LQLRLEPLEDRRLLSYSVTDLGSLGGVVGATDINASAQIVGEAATTEGATHAFLWNNGAMIDLGTLGGSFSRAYGINDAGQVVGDSDLSNDAYATRAFLLTPEDTDGNGTPDRWFRDSNGDGANDLMRNLGTLGVNNATSHANDVNNLGQVVGHASWPTSSGYVTRAVRWHNGSISDLGSGSARAINDAGLVTGWAPLSGSLQTFLWKNGTMTYLGATNEGGLDMNGSGQLIDKASYGFGRLWTPTVPNGTTGAFRDLGVLPPTDPMFFPDSVPYGINNQGQVVGNSPQTEPWDGGYMNRGVVWTNGVVEQLPVDIAVAINDVGQIIGNRDGRAYLLTPRPDLPQLSIQGGIITEGHSGTTNLEFEVSLSRASTEVITVQYSTVDDPSMAGIDYVATSDTLTFAPGETTKPASVAVIGDRLGDGWDESFSVVLTNASGAYIENGSALGIIADDEPRISGGGVVVESNEPVTRFVRVSLSQTYDQPITADYFTADVDWPSSYRWRPALAGSDYLPISGSVTIPAGHPFVDVPLTMLGDRVVETYFEVSDWGTWSSKSEAFSFVINNSSTNATPGGVGVVEIVDDEPLVSINPYVIVSEGNSATPNAVFTVTLSGKYDQEVAVNYATFDPYYYYPDVAEAGKDYVQTTGTLRFPPGETSRTVSVPILDDSWVEQPEYFDVRLGETSSYAIVDPALNLGTAQIDDVEPPTLSISDATRQEGNSGTATITFTVSLSSTSTETVSVSYTTANGSAAAGTDYQAKSGTLTFAPGETSRTVTVQVIGDRAPEADESFFVNLGSANAIIGDAQGQGTIIDDEPRIRISDVSKSEGRKGKSTQFTFTITLSASYDQPVTISYRTVDGSANTSDVDYIAKTDTLTFKPGETQKTITITVKGDSKKEANEEFYVELFGNSSNSLLTKSRGIGSILNDD